MKIETPAALRFIIQDDIYLLPADKTEPVSKPAETILKTPKIDFNYLGKNNKKFLVVTHYTGHEFIADAHLTALESILKRKDYALKDVAIFNLANHVQADTEQLKNYFNPQKILFLGKNALPANIEELAFNQPKTIAGIMVLYSFSFDDMMDDVANKKAFWEQMKTL